MHLVKSAVLVCVCAASVAAQSASPVEAMLRRGVGDPTFHVDQPAYVAVFEFVPGQDVQQVYPRSASEAAQLTGAGEHQLSNVFGSDRGSYPMARQVSTTSTSGRTQTMYLASSRSMSLPPTRTLLLVASRTPLRHVGSRDATRGWLPQVSGFRSAQNTTFASEPMVTAIINAVMPAGLPDDDRVSDVLELDVASVASVNRYAGQSISFGCPSGTVSVSAQLFYDTGFFRCPENPFNQPQLKGVAANGTSSAEGSVAATRAPVLARQKSGESATAPSKKGSPQ